MLQVTATFIIDGQEHIVEFSEANGAGGGSCQVIVNNFYIGSIVRYTKSKLWTWPELESFEQNWEGRFNSPTFLTGDDIGVIVDLMEGRGY